LDFLAPFVRRLTTYYQTEEPDAIYQQAQMIWKTYSIVTASNNYKTFSCADLPGIVVKQTSNIAGNEKSSTGKTHYAPIVYRIDFCINITVWILFFFRNGNIKIFFLLCRYVSRMLHLVSFVLLYHRVPLDL
jgi:hypothetical protein